MVMFSVSVCFSVLVALTTGHPLHDNLQTITSIEEVPANSIAECPHVQDEEDFLFKIDSVCYHYIEGKDGFKVDFDAAEADCRSRDGHLLTISDNSTQQALLKADRLGRVSDSHTIILGLRLHGSTWKWTSGVEVKFFNWDPSVKTSGNCVIMTIAKGAKWERYDCATSEWYYAYVCEYNAAKSKSDTLSSQTTAIPVLASILTLLTMLIH